jgi:spermidine synthase
VKGSGINIGGNLRRLRPRTELLADAEADNGWWLVVGGSEQSYVDLNNPAHLEFEYVQLISYVIDEMFGTDLPIDALHLGGGLCTIPRWLEACHPGSKQRVAEASEEIAMLARSIGSLARIDLRVEDAMVPLKAARKSSLDLIVSDVYDGPETVRSVYPRDVLESARAKLRPDGLYICNISDAAPFAMAKVVAATIREVFETVALLVEPGVLRGRRTGNVVIAGTDGELDIDAVTRSAAAGVTRARVMADEDLEAFIGDATAATAEEEIPASGES